MTGSDGLVLRAGGAGLDATPDEVRTVHAGLPGGGHVVWLLGFGARADALRGPHLAREVAGGEFFLSGP